MLLITTIKVTVSHRRVIAGRLYNLKSGDVLDVAQYPGDMDADISAHEAALMLDGDMAEEGEERELEEGEVRALNSKRGDSHPRIHNFDLSREAA